MYSEWAKEIIRIEELMTEYMMLKAQVHPLSIFEEDETLDKMKEYREHIITQMYIKCITH